MEEGYRVRNYCWIIIQTIYFVKAYDSYNTLHQKYTNTEKMQSTWKTEHVLCFLKAGGSKISNMTFPRVKSKLHKYTHTNIYILEKQGLQWYQIWYQNQQQQRPGSNDNGSNTNWSDDNEFVSNDNESRSHSQFAPFHISFELQTIFI